MSIRPAQRTFHFKHADTRLLAGAGAAFVVVAAALHLVLPSIALTVLLFLSVLFLAGIALEMHRRREVADAQTIRQVQALLELHTVLRPRRPLPPFTGWAASPELAITVARLILENRPLHVLELGSGVSTLVAGYALDELGAGRITAIDHDGSFAEQTRRHVSNHGLDARVAVVTAPLVEQQVEGESWHWYDVGKAQIELPVDMLVVDGPPRETRSLARFPALPALRARLSERAIIVLDDAYRDDEQEILRRWLSRYPEFNLTYQESGKGIAVLTRKSNTSH